MAMYEMKFQTMTPYHRIWQEYLPALSLSTTPDNNNANHEGITGRFSQFKGR